MNFEGITIGIAAFIIIGVFHPIVIKTEYYIGVKAWPVFLIVGLISVAASLFIPSLILSGIVSVFGFASLWSINELKEQVERAEKGWFPANPNREKNLK